MSKDARGELLKMRIRFRDLEIEKQKHQEEISRLAQEQAKVSKIQAEIVQKHPELAASVGSGMDW